MRLILAFVLALGLSACGMRDDPPRTATPKAPSSSPSEPAPDQGDPSATKVCAEVRAGVDAFNTGDFQGTVDHFRRAVPLAEQQARTDSTDEADALLEAVRYYADLAPGDYPSSAASSSEFAKYKLITLSLCVSPETPLEIPTESPGVTA
jgi:hypothetical protein